MSGYRVGIDVGGTFTDLICVTPEGRVLLDKTATTPEDQSVGVMNGLALLAQREGREVDEFCSLIEVLVHGTTTADNTMIEMDGAITGMLVTEGHRDEIEMRRVHKEQIWDPSYPAPAPIARRRARIPIPQRMDYLGEELLALDEAAVRCGVQRLKQLGVESIAVVFLFSFVDPSHELRAREIILEEYPEVAHISLSHEVMARGPEFERTSTTLVNAYTAPRITMYVEQLEQKLQSAGCTAPLLLMQATGGVMPPSYVSHRAVTLLGSGPTGGVIGAARAAAEAGVTEFVAIDMGGTSFDICLVRDGLPEVKADWNWRYRYYIGLPMVDIQCIGAGGGSIARVRQGTLLVGPESAGAQPGPACYGRGGTRPTVTDADAVLGYLRPTGFADGRMDLDLEAAREAIRTEVAGPLGVDLIAAAWGIERIVNANMAAATRKVLAGYGADARELSLIAYGGNGAVHAWAIAEELGVTRVLIPRAAPVFSALGLLIADYRVDLQLAHVSPIRLVDPAQLHRMLTDLSAEAVAELNPAQLNPDQIEIQLFVQMAYPGQNFDLSVPVPSAGETSEFLVELIERFHDQHLAERGFAFRENSPLLRGVRALVTGSTPHPPTLAESAGVKDLEGARTGYRPVHFGSGFVESPTFDGGLLGAGIRVTGPALIEERFTVIVIPPGWTAELLESSSFELSKD
ncbi:N-methylhydantoinase A/acetone carboxylase, beta subunit [Actinobacteria bacterium IMCC26207]|nr:N-methylhydantoinase A/acetone carboxylase, beta subunit [Actinobacteria bacterium IMCC26207]